MSIMSEILWEKYTESVSYDAECTNLSWQEEYSLYLGEEERLLLKRTETFDEGISLTLAKGVSWAKKKSKHVNDTKRHFRDVKLNMCKIEYREWSYAEHVCHKHLRQEDVSTLRQDVLDNFDKERWEALIEEDKYIDYLY